VGAPIITFTSDFGLDDWFVGVVHGVLHETCPAARIVDLTHGIPPGDIARAAFMIEAASPDFPPGTVHLVVVDPGVGTTRRALAVDARGQRFVGPDNGVLEWALEADDAQCHALTATRFFRPEVSRTFHGRDVFAPVAAHLANREVLTAFGPAVTDPVRLPSHEPRIVDGELHGRVVLVDHFGNALTDITAEALARTFPGVAESELAIRSAGRTLRGVSRSYGDAPLGTFVAIIGSSGRLELAEVGGHAASRWGLGAGDDVAVRVARA
jgi:hypothetical protein